ncbi:uncharacterized protein LOC143078553 [Mytilus galloprovincialis]|uniref:uncharacterized protein LOC143078553 n=1 Tax=Mytilus galloprovincialis TaxID=29158 RepID=UPI003F7B3A33
MPAVFAMNYQQQNVSKYFRWKEFSRDALISKYISIISVVVGLHNHHPRPPPPQPPQRPRPPPPRPPPPRTTTPTPTTSTSTTTPAPEVEIELEEISTTLAPNSTTVASSTVRQPAAHYQQGAYPYNYYNQYYQNSGQPSSQNQHSQPYNYYQNYNSQPYDQNQNYNRQSYDQNQYYNQAQGYNSGYYSGQSYVAGPGQNQPAHNHVTGAPHPTTYPYHQNHPPNNPYSATQPPPAAHAPYAQPPTPISAGHYYPPDQSSNHQQHQQPNPAQPQPDYYSQQNQYQQGNNQQPPPAQPLTQADYHSQQNQYQQTNNQQPDPAYQPGPAGPPARPQGPNPPQRLPTPPANSLPQQASSGRRQTQPVNSRPVVEEKYQTRYERPRSYKADISLPTAPIPLQESRRTVIVDNRPIAQSPDVRYNEVARDSPVDRRTSVKSQDVRYNEVARDTPVDRRTSVQSQDVRYTEVVRDSQVDRRPVEKSPTVRYVEPRSETVYVQTLDRRQPEAPTAESRYYKADQRPSDSISYRNSVDIPRRSETRTEISRQAADYGIGTETIASESRYLQKSEGKPPGNIAYLKSLDSPSATIKAEYNYMKEPEKRQRLPTENQLLEIKRQQLELLKLLQREKEKSTKRQNPYFKALFENKTPELNKEKIPKAKDQCPLYKYTVEKDRIEIHTEPGRCKIVIKLPKDGTGKPKVSYLSRN